MRTVKNVFLKWRPMVDLGGCALYAALYSKFSEKYSLLRNLEYEIK